MKECKLIAAVCVAVFFVAGCTGMPMKTQNLNEGDYTVIGKGEATATGIMLFQIIPIGQNDRFTRAQEAAIKSKGGDAMINTQVQENWFWAYVLNGYKTTVSGDIIKFNEGK